MRSRKAERLLRFLREEDGVGTIWGLYLSVFLLAIGGLALDGANAWREQNQLQVAVDAAALGAAANIADLDDAREVARALADHNLADSEISLRDSDVVFGNFEDSSFSGGAEPINAVRVTAERVRSRGNEVRTHLLRLVGRDSFDVAVSSVALANVGSGCSTTTIYSKGIIRPSGGNTYLNGTCLHGEQGVSTGGNDYFDETVRLSAAKKEWVSIHSPRQGSASAEQVAMERSMEPKLLPLIDQRWSDLWSVLWDGGQSHYVGKLLPEFIFANGAPAKIVRKEGWWNIQSGDVEPNTIYVVNGGAQFAGGVDAKNVAFVVNGQFGVGGGSSLHFEDMFVMAAGDMNLAGSVHWGSDDVCEEGRYSVYLLGKQRLQLGGWGNAVPVNGVVAAAQDLNPGGAMNATGIYFESEKDLQTGGNTVITGCDQPLTGIYDLATGGGGGTTFSGGSHLVR